MSDFKIRSYESVMKETYNRVESNKCFDIKLKPYKKDFLEKVLFYFEEKEEFEKCVIINNFINQRFSHELNYIK